MGRMIQSGHHRGPDSAGHMVIRTGQRIIHFGHNRLKITDLRDSANQPMTSPDGRYTLVYNGAIYNYQKLEQELRSKYLFHTGSDTELVLYWLMEHGVSGLSALNGMFALTFYDRQTDQLLLARDRWGIKPLFYFENEKYLIVSSEIKSLLASGLMERRPAWEQIPHYLQFKYPFRPGTFYKDIFEVMPGRVMKSIPGPFLWEESQLIKSHTDEPGDSKLPVESTLKYLKDALTTTVVRHLQADVAAGLFLSGGIDSTLLLALAREVGVRQLPAFTITYTPEDEPYTTQDSFYARRAAGQFGADLHEVKIDRSLLENFWDWLPTLDQPIGDGAAWLTYLLSKDAKREVSVILSGAGADELFGGYNRHWAYYQYLKHYHWLRKVVPFSHRLAGRLPEVNAEGRLLNKLAAQLHPSPAQTYLNFTTQRFDQFTFPPGFHGEQPDQLNNFHSSGQAAFREKNLVMALRHDQQHYLPADILAITDRMTMQHGIEARLPYLDATVSAFAQSLPATFRLRHGRKWMLKSILSQLGGKTFVNRRKEGFGMPLGHWLRMDAGKPLLGLLQNQKSEIYHVLLYKDVQLMLTAHLSGKYDYTAELWTLLVLAGWLKQELNG